MKTKKKTHKPILSGVVLYATVKADSIEYKNPRIGFKLNKSIARFVGQQFKQLKDELELLDEFLVYTLTFDEQFIRLTESRGDDSNIYQSKVVESWLNGGK